MMRYKVGTRHKQLTAAGGVASPRHSSSTARHALMRTLSVNQGEHTFTLSRTYIPEQTLNTLDIGGEPVWIMLCKPLIDL